MTRLRLRPWIRSARFSQAAALTRSITSVVERLEDRRLLSTYDVGPGQAYTTIRAVPWEKLGAGDTVQIHWQAAAYHEKVLISTSGTASKPIRIIGIAGPHGERPVLDGRNASTRAKASYPFAATQDRGLVTITRDTAHPYGFKPSYIQIEGLALRNANELYTFKDGGGGTRTYAANAASVFVERGEHITIKKCVITGSGNGLFVASGDEEAVLSRDIRVEANDIYGNGNVGSDRYHNVYTAAAGILFQYNHFGDLRPGALGGGLKDRSAGTVIRYNWIEGGARLLDLVDPEDSPTLMPTQPKFRHTYVYGNVLLDGPEDAGTLIHYGGDSGVTSNYRKGTLHLFNNTVVVKADQQERYSTSLVEADTNDENVEIANNILYTQSATTGAAATQFNLVTSNGTVRVKTNWISPGWLVSSAFGGFQGTITGTNKITPRSGNANKPGFVNLAANDFHLTATSAAVDKGRAADAPSPVARQYVANRSSTARAESGTATDLGAFEYVATTAGATKGITRGTSSTKYVDLNNTTSTVDGSAAKPFRTIQAAVNAAGANATIKVAAGTYKENVTIPDKGLTLLGGFTGATSAQYAQNKAGDFATSDPSKHVTKIAAKSKSSPVVFLNNITEKTIRVEGFTISGGNHGVYVEGDFQQFPNVTISRNVIEKNGPAALQDGGDGFAIYGGGIYSNNATVTITNNLIRNNNANRGAGILVGSRSDYSITKNRIYSNTGWDDHGGGVMLVPMPVSAPGKGRFAYNTVRDNVAAKAFDYGWAGGILVAGDLDPSAIKKVTLDHNIWTGNYAPTAGGAIFADNGATVVLDHELVYKNRTQSGHAGGIYVDGDGGGTGSSMTIDHCTVADNSNGGDNLGNGVYVEEYSKVTVKNSIFWGNGQDFYVVPDNTGSKLTVTYSISQQKRSGTGNVNKNPLFANPAAGDYHEKSAAGRWNPLAKGGAGDWATDAVTSPAIDAGDPSAAFSAEPDSDGARLNMGVYGNTSQASRSPSRR